jgi:hypothetical protein
MYCTTEYANFARIGQLACKLAYSTIFMKPTILVIIPLVF